MAKEIDQLKQSLTRLEEALNDCCPTSTDRLQDCEWQATFDAVADMVSIHDTDFRLVKVNKRFAEAFNGGQPEKLLGRPCYEVCHQGQRVIDGCPFRRLMASGQKAGWEFYEPKLEMNLEVTASPLRDEHGSIIGCVHVARDITGRKRMEENMLVTDRLASIGELVAGVAHEINNPLTGVIGYLELIMAGNVPDNLKEDIAIAHHEAMRAAGAAGSLLAFARKHAPVRKLLNINSIIATVLKLRSYEQRVHNVEARAVFARDIPMIMADALQMQQVFLNIVINAEYFMIAANDGGRLTITTERAGDMVKITFADDGTGVAEEDKTHIFEPFYTTKEEGRGTGLGLSICRGIVNQHGGQIYLDSPPGRGASFIVELPIAAEEEGEPLD